MYARRKCPVDFARTPEHIRRVKLAASLIEVLRKRVLRRIPGVQTSFCGWAYDCMIQEDKILIERAWEEHVDL